MFYKIIYFKHRTRYIKATEKNKLLILIEMAAWPNKQQPENEHFAFNLVSIGNKNPKCMLNAVCNF